MTAINKRIKEKDKKALRRIKRYKRAELCLCIDDGGMLDNLSFDLLLKIDTNCVFDEMFFITSSRLFTFDSINGVKEFHRIIDLNKNDRERTPVY